MSVFTCSVKPAHKTLFALYCGFLIFLSSSWRYSAHHRPPKLLPSPGSRVVLVISPPSRSTPSFTLRKAVVSRIWQSSVCLNSDVFRLGRHLESKTVRDRPSHVMIRQMSPYASQHANTNQVWPNGPACLAIFTIFWIAFSTDMFDDGIACSYYTVYCLISWTVYYR